MRTYCGEWDDWTVSWLEQGLNIIQHVELALPFVTTPACEGGKRLWVGLEQVAHQRDGMDKMNETGPTQKVLEMDKFEMIPRIKHKKM